MGVIEDAFPLQPLLDNVFKVNVLPLVNVTLEDAGEYICMVKNSAGWTSNSAWVEVLTGEPFYSFFLKIFCGISGKIPHSVDRLRNKALPRSFLEILPAKSTDGLTGAENPTGMRDPRSFALFKLS